MGFIGKEPLTGAYNMLDNLTASATASYSLTLDSTAFVPESANHLLVSLNGSIQKAGSSYTVSGSTLTFSSTLASSDSIDFVLALGNVLDIGTPSDSTVTNAKTNFVSTSSAAGLQIKGDGTTDGTLQLNCSQNSHGIKLKSPAHSASASYTLTFPTTDGSADEFLKTDGSGVLSWASAGGSNTPAFAASNDSTIDSISDNTDTKVALDKEVIDVGGCFNNTGSQVTLNGITVPSYSFAPNEAGTYLFTGAVGLESHNGSVENAYIEIRKNGTAIQRIYHNTGGGTVYDVSNAFAVVATADGVDDYFEMYIKINWNGSSSGKLLDEQNTQFIGFKLIGA